MNCSSLYTQKDLTQKVKPRHTGGYRLDLQVNNVRKTFTVLRLAMLAAANVPKKLSRGLVEVPRRKATPSQRIKYFKTLSMTKKLSPMISTISRITTKTIFSPSSVKSLFFL